MNLTAEDKLILELATEDSYNLWESAWILQRLYPNESFESLRNRAIHALTGLVAQGLLEIETRDRISGNKKILELVDAERELASVTNWDSENVNLPYEVEFVATMRGDEMYRSCTA